MGRETQRSVVQGNGAQGAQFVDNVGAVVYAYVYVNVQVDTGVGVDAGVGGEALEGFEEGGVGHFGGGGWWLVCYESSQSKVAGVVCKTLLINLFTVSPIQPHTHFKGDRKVLTANGEWDAEPLFELGYSPVLFVNGGLLRSLIMDTWD